MNSFAIRALFAFVLIVSLPESAYAQREKMESDDGSHRDPEDNPPPPRTDPELRRSRAVGLPGQNRPRPEKTGARAGAGLPYRGLREPVSEEQGLSVVRKADSKDFVTTAFLPRLLFLNGVNVSSLRGETLENVQLRIDEEGNLHINAPHYEVSTDSSFHPLLPTELPRLPKGRTAPLELPQGRFAKPANKPAAKAEIVPETNLDERSASLPVSDAPESRFSRSPRTLRVGSEAGDAVPGEATQGAKAVPPR